MYRKKIIVDRDAQTTKELLDDINFMAQNINAFNNTLKSYGLDNVDSTMGEVAEDYMSLKKTHKEMLAFEEATRKVERIFELPNVNANVVEDFAQIKNKWNRKLAELNGEH